MPLTEVLLLGSIFLFSLAHSHVGCGAPESGILMSMGSPARTLSFLPSKPSRYNLGASVGMQVFKLKLNLQYSKVLE